MGFFYPGALYLFALLPVLTLAYLVRERPRRVIVSSVIAFRALSARRGRRFGGWPRPDWMFLVELLILALAVLAIAGPYVVRAGNPIAVVLDDSASMQAPAAATTGGSSKATRTRFDAARADIKQALDDQTGAGEVTVYLTAPQPHRLATPFSSVAGAVSALNRLKPTDSRANPEALASLLSRLAGNQRLRRVVYAGAQPLATPVPARIEAFTVGGPVPNYAIGSFLLRREALGRAALHARLAVANFSPTAQTLEATIDADGKPLAHASAHLKPGQAGAFEFPNLPPAAVYRARLKPDDGFMLDNTAYATAGAVKSMSILFVTPTPADAAGLNTLPGISVRVASPATFTPKDLASADLAIFEYSVPKRMPPVNSLLVMPPPGDPIFNFNVKPATQLEITSWPPTNQLTDSVNFRLLNLHAGEYFGQHPWLQPIASGNDGGLILAGERAGHRFVALGFNPFPYLGKRNLPMSVLTLNCLSYLGGFGAETTGYHTGEPWSVPAGVTAIVLPSGRRIAVTPGTLFTNVQQQGLYQLISSDGGSTRRAINLADLRESDLENVPALKIEAPGGAASVATVAPRREPLADKLIIAILVLAMIEALLAYRRRRRTVAV